MKSNLDVWAIQGDKEEMNAAFQNVEKESLGNILYLNCICSFKMDNKKIQSRKFDSCFYSEESDIVILFAKGMVSEEEIETYLNENNIKYTTIRFTEDNIPFENDDKFPELWFAREKCVLLDAINDSLKKGNNRCLYNSEVESNLSLCYRDKFGDKWEIEGRFCKGCLYFKDKMVLLINQADFRNLKENDVMKILKDKKIICNKSNKR